MSNQHDAELRRRAELVAGKLDEIAGLQDELKKLKEEAKADGYDMKAFGQVVREMRKGADYQVAQLELELVLETYRGAVGLPTTLEDAQKIAADEARSVPEPEPRRRKVRSLEDALADPALEGTAVAFGDGPFHELGPSRRKGRKDVN